MEKNNMEELDLDNILSGDEIATLFEEPPKKEPKEEPKEEKKEETTDFDEDNPFGTSQKESVGSEDEDIQGKGDTDDKGISSSPKNKNFYSSITDALVVDGIFPDLDKETIQNVKTPEDFQKIIEEQINARFTEKEKRINEALNNKVEPSVVQQYESTIDYLNNINDDSLSAEDEEGENLRRQLIYNDYLNRGFSKTRAEKMVNDAIENGTDIDDAKDALQGVKDFYNNKYKEILDSAKENEEKLAEERTKQSENLKKSIMEDKNLYGDVDVDKATRTKIYDFITKPVHKDSNGNYMTALQKYQSENTIEAMKNFAICYTLTNGFKDWSKLGSKQAKKEVKKGLANLEKVINSTSRNNDGSLGFVSFDESSYLGQGMQLDI
jgi:hypothetical protein|nr:MAG: hypothetical protein [Bacteriophage sp.]UWI03908.1 MAG: hypothetical protein [Bacteriophage sp.]UWI39075.1 MAG: hypothetical protein [Bacteriophage sp.]